MAKAATQPDTAHSDRIPVLVMSCNRVEIRRCVAALLQHRPSHRFPIIVSQDCGDAKTRSVIRDEFGAQVTLLEQPDLSKISVEQRFLQFTGYYNIARHYRWALSQVFDVLFYSAVIIVEDDLEIAPDFFDYFAATRPLLDQDDTLMAVSAWNDNGNDEFVQSPTRLYRSDFFPGLGWMLTSRLWAELAPKWPKSFWDDWLREPAQRKGRSFIRPEISRVSNFGRVGVSKGQYFDAHVGRIQHVREPVPFLTLNLDYLLKDRYDPAFHSAVYAARTVSLAQARADSTSTDDIRITYTTDRELAHLEKQLGLMDDVKAGVARTAYRGVVTFYLNKKRRVFLAPPESWSGYAQ